MAKPLPVALDKLTQQMVIDDNDLIGKKGKNAPYTCFTSVVVGRFGTTHYIQNMPIHRWLLQAVFTEAAWDTVGVNVANSKAFRRAGKVTTPRDTQSMNSELAIKKPRSGSRARQGKRIRFELQGTLRTALVALQATTMPKNFMLASGGKTVGGGSTLLPSRCTNSQIGAWAAVNVAPSRIDDFIGGGVYTIGGTFIPVVTLAANADLVKEIGSMSATLNGKLLAIPVVAYE